MAFTIPSADEALAPLVQSQIFETDLAILIAGSSGTGVVSDCGVTAQGSPDMTVAVASGTILAAGVAVSVTSGNLTVGAADATNPRVDLISASAAGVKTITAGTAAAVASVKPPDLPSGHIALAFVYVAATDTAINTNEITDKRVMLSTGVFGTPANTYGTPAAGAASTAIRTDAVLPLPALAFGQALITAATTLGSSFADITGASVTLTTAARRVRISLNTTAVFAALATNQFVEAILMIDGALVSAATAGQTLVGTPVLAAQTVYLPIIIAGYLSAVLTAGSHTIKAQGRYVNSNSQQIGVANLEGFLTVEETLLTT